MRGKQPEPIKIEKILDPISRAMDESKSVKNQDTIIHELKRLNENIESLNKK